MNVFIDTSTLFKLYQNEDGSEIIYNYLKNNEIKYIYLSEITKIEFHSVIWKKVRMKELTIEISETIINNFISDSKYYNFIQIGNEIINNALYLLAKYNKLGLRSLDSIQISSSMFSSEEIDLIITSDKIFHEVLIFENKDSLFI
jgi:predicted nucleic acid-binding protein